MKDFKRTDLLFSLCGLNCGLCPMHLDGYCPGCGGGDGNQPCKIAKCSLNHGKIEYCSHCQSFPCDKQEGIDEFDSFITRQNRMKDLMKMKEIGTESYQAEQKEKIEILKYLLENFHDGRKKTFYCLTVNLLELADLNMVLAQIKAYKEIEGLSLKEKSAYVAGLFQEVAQQRQIILKLKKKPKRVERTKGK